MLRRTLHGGIDVGLGDTTSVDGTLLARFDSINDIGGTQALQRDTVLVLKKKEEEKSGLRTSRRNLHAEYLQKSC